MRRALEALVHREYSNGGRGGVKLSSFFYGKGGTYGKEVETLCRQ